MPAAGRGPPAIGLEPVFDELPVRAAGLEGEQGGRLHVCRAADGRMRAMGDQHQLFGKGRQRRQRGARVGQARRFGNECAVDLEVRQRLDRLVRRHGHQLQLHARPALVQRRQQGGQAAGGGAFHRGDTQASVRLARPPEWRSSLPLRELEHLFVYWDVS